MKKLVLCLFSGGIDSTVLVKHYLDRGWDVVTLNVDYGQAIAPREKEAVTDIGRELGFPVRFVNTVLLFADGFFYPIRNAHLLTVAINQAYELKIPRVAIGCNQGEFLDQRPEFIDRFNFMQEYCLKKPIWVLAPFANWSSERVIRHGLKIKVPLHLTVSCMEIPACGECLKCKLRKKYKIDEKSNFAKEEKG